MRDDPELRHADALLPNRMSTVHLNNLLGWGRCVRLCFVHMYVQPSAAPRIYGAWADDRSVHPHASDVRN